MALVIMVPSVRLRFDVSIRFHRIKFFIGIVFTYRLYSVSSVVSRTHLGTNCQGLYIATHVLSTLR